VRGDRARWDARYAAGDWVPIDEVAEVVARAWDRLPTSGWAWDVACGAGRHSLRLARRGLHVLATDLSWEGLRRCQARARPEGLWVYPVCADLEVWRPRPGALFDVIVNTYFLLRRLFPLYREHLRPGGWLLVETYHVDEIDVCGGDIRRAYALERGELLREFGDLEILEHAEGVFETSAGERGLGRLIARKPVPRAG
jgi:tellurite methyltransferase